MDYIVSYAQNREDIVLRAYLRDVVDGFYVDVGASHPTSLSVTRLFYEAGWRGVNIEPIPTLVDELRRARPRDVNLNIGVSDRPGLLDFHYYPNQSGLSTFSPSVHHEVIAGGQIDPGSEIDLQVRVETLASVLQAHVDNEIHFMKIDVEGHEYEVIRGNDWHRFRPWVLCVEANHDLRDGDAILVENRYTETYFDGLNRYFVADEHADLIDNFDYPDVLLDRIVIRAEIHDFIESARATYTAEVAALRDLLANAEAELAQAQRLRGAGRLLAHAIRNVAYYRGRAILGLASSDKLENPRPSGR